MANHIVASSSGGDFPAKLTKQVVLCSLIAAFGASCLDMTLAYQLGCRVLLQEVWAEAHHANGGGLLLGGSHSQRRLHESLTCSSPDVFVWVPASDSEIRQCHYSYQKSLRQSTVEGLNVCFQMLITIGILIANVVNYFTSKIHPYGWRISLGGAGFPAIFLGLGSLLIVETPTSLIERGKTEEGLKALKTTRGVEDVQKEYEEIVRATETAKNVKHPFRNLIMKRSSWPQLFCGTILQVFQQFTGINVIMFYAPVLFQTMGLGADAFCCQRSSPAPSTPSPHWLQSLGLINLEEGNCSYKLLSKCLFLSTNMICTFIIAQAFLNNAVPDEVRDLLLLRGLDRRNGQLCGLLAAGKQREFPLMR
ncbi:Sugar transport protein 6 [Sesamum alatum]|uniref:Sugar transport protein 6 n=1 Tax=Sesamum alatum TaxID=300844 RepID=A0AAE1XXP7_9LAMI|nr:Sugar transport protein 6 [Sesamum alatum]